MVEVACIGWVSVGFGALDFSDDQYTGEKRGCRRVGAVVQAPHGKCDRPWARSRDGTLDLDPNAVSQRVKRGLQVRVTW